MDHIEFFSAGLFQYAHMFEVGRVYHIQHVKKVLETYSGPCFYMLLRPTWKVGRVVPALPPEQLSTELIKKNQPKKIVCQSGN
jgi:hypothetical protein